MKKTALFETHVGMGAKMVPFAGYEMPVQYKGVKMEHLAVRTQLGVFDVSHMGEFFVEGPDAVDFLQKVTTNDVSKLVDGKAQYTCMPNGKGGIIDDLLIYRFAEQRYLLVVNASNIEKDWNWLQSHMEGDVTLTNESDSYSLLAVQGPKAIEAMQELTSIDLAGMKYYTFQVGEFAGQKDIIISATGYTGSGGFEIYCKNESAVDVWEAVLKAGSKYGIEPAGLAARDTLRLEMGFCLYGNDIDDTTSPIEAGLGWITKLAKGDFIDRDVLAKQKEEGVSRKLVALEIKGRGIPRQGYIINDSEGNAIGTVTSGTMAPSLNKGIALGYVANEHNSAGSTVFIEVRSKQVEAEVVKLPFYKPA